MSVMESGVVDRTEAERAYPGLSGRAVQLGFDVLGAVQDRDAAVGQAAVVGRARPIGMFHRTVHGALLP